MRLLYSTPLRAYGWLRARTETRPLFGSEWLTPTPRLRVRVGNNSVTYLGPPLDSYGFMPCSICYSTHTSVDTLNGLRGAGTCRCPVCVCVCTCHLFYLLAQSGGALSDLSYLPGRFDEESKEPSKAENFCWQAAC